MSKKYSKYVWQFAGMCDQFQVQSQQLSSSVSVTVCQLGTGDREAKALGYVGRGKALLQYLYQR